MTLSFSARICAAMAMLSLAACAGAPAPGCDFAGAGDAKPVLVNVNYGSLPASTAASSSRVDLAVLPDDGPVVLFLTSLRSVEWRLAVMPGASVAGVFLSGPAESEVYGAPAGSVLVRNRTGDSNAACEQAGIRPLNLTPSSSPQQATAASRQFPRKVMPHAETLEIVKPEAGRLTLTNKPWPVAADVVIAETGPTFDPTFLRPGNWGLMQLVLRGDIELARGDDLVKAWRSGALQRLDALPADSAPLRPDARPGRIATARADMSSRWGDSPYWIVKRSITIPKDLMSMTFIVPAGAPPPRGELGRATILLMEKFECAGGGCPEPLRVPVAPVDTATRLGPPAMNSRDPTPQDYLALARNGGEVELLGLRELLRRGGGS